ncbi:MAG: hypothetical protein A2910_00095 [Candidatus Yanofskybacteria bacterium RIFCSPLOWO2_01_FULL_39_28]|nr:MAG: hypothetical protein A2910_00095 [Candidatus Yanofskybacteria bacterium RIFCSPLOWO2_01_FULL_39_28]
MKILLKILLRFFFIFAMFLFIGCEESQAAKEIRLRQTAERVTQQKVRVAEEIVSNINYFMDPRTKLCFAYYRENYSKGGPALATVPCEAIQPNLLGTAPISE